MAATVEEPGGVGTNKFGLDTNLFTRGGNAPDNRGESMVQKHERTRQEALQKLALEKLTALLPTLSTATCVLALKEAKWDVDAALPLLREFQELYNAQLDALQKKRRRALEDALQQRKPVAAPAPGDESGSDGSGASSGSGESTGDSGSESSDDERDKKKRRSSKKDSKSSRDKDKGSKHKSKRSRDKDKDRDKDKKKRKKAKSDKAKPKPSSAADNFGKYGILKESDMNAKRDEFMMWAAEVKKADIEGLSKWEERDLFRTYMDDYNTASLPSKKYYNIEAYERERALKEAKRASKGDGRQHPANVKDDEEALRRARLAERERLAKERQDEAYKEIKYTGKGKDMLEQEMLRMKMSLAYRTGDTANALKMMERLKPEDQKKK